MVIYFIRHGQTNYNVERRYQGMWGESELTEEGVAQAKALAPHLADVPFDRYYVSGALRAAQTAAVLFPERQNEIIYKDILREVDTGSLTDLLDADCRFAYPDEFAARESGEDFSAWGGESPATTKERAKKALDEIIAGGGETVVVVSHGAFIRAVLCVAMGFPQSQAFSVMNNCGVAALKIEGDKKKLLFFNRTANDLLA